MISARGLTKVYEENSTSTHALNGVSLEIKEGEFVAIMGPSGSGKSTLLHILSFLDRPTSGSYAFSGKHMEELGDDELAQARNLEIGFIFQAFNLLSRSSVYENVELPLLYAGVPHLNRKARIEEAVQSVGLNKKLYTEVGRLSGGEKQRVAIARALVNTPKIIFADEPTGNLDSASGTQIMKLLEKLHHGGRTIVLVTHETYTARFAERLVRLKDGTVEFDGPIENAKLKDQTEK